jgi:uncharacterized protein DUF5681
VSDDSDAKVGYKKPPRQHQFKKGQSGNPNGRRRSRRGRAQTCTELGTLFGNEFRAEIHVRNGEETRKLSKAEAMLRGVMNNALQGDRKAISRIFKLAHRLGKLAPSAADEAPKSGTLEVDLEDYEAVTGYPVPDAWWKWRDRQSTRSISRDGNQPASNKCTEAPDDKLSSNCAASNNADNEVGYKRPPVATRFKKGRSGNPKGRPKRGGQSISEIFDRILAEPVRIREGKRTRSVTTAEAFAKVATTVSLKGDLGTFDALMIAAGKMNRLTKPSDQATQVGYLVLPNIRPTTYQDWFELFGESLANNVSAASNQQWVDEVLSKSGDGPESPPRDSGL